MPEEDMYNPGDLEKSIKTRWLTVVPEELAGL